MLFWAVSCVLEEQLFLKKSIKGKVEGGMCQFYNQLKRKLLVWPGTCFQPAWLGKTGCSERMFCDGLTQATSMESGFESVLAVCLWICHIKSCQFTKNYWTRVLRILRRLKWNYSVLHLNFWFWKTAVCGFCPCVLSSCFCIGLASWLPN